MSVISETQENEKITIIEAFTCCEYGKEFSWDNAKGFEIGDEVYFLDEYKNPDSLFSQDHLSWMIKFRANDGKTYSANQLYFVTNDHWNSLKTYFKQKLEHE